MEWFIESDLSNERHKSVVRPTAQNANKYIDLFCQPRSAPVLRWEAVTRAGSRRQVARRLSSKAPDGQHTKSRRNVADGRALSVEEAEAQR